MVQEGGTQTEPGSSLELKRDGWDLDRPRTEVQKAESRREDGCTEKLLWRSTEDTLTISAEYVGVYDCEEITGGEEKNHLKGADIQSSDRCKDTSCSKQPEGKTS